LTKRDASGQISWPDSSGRRAVEPAELETAYAQVVSHDLDVPSERGNVVPGAAAGGRSDDHEFRGRNVGCSGATFSFADRTERRIA
jgi:hypothetical protein